MDPYADALHARSLESSPRLRTPRNSTIDIGGSVTGSGGSCNLILPEYAMLHNGQSGHPSRPSSGAHGRGTDYRVAVNLPNGDKAKLFGRAGMSVESLIQPLVQELHWTEYRVVLSSSRQAVNLEESSAVLDGKEIDIEDIGAMRKNTGMEFLETERLYFSSLNLVIDTYAEPLKKWRLHKNSLDILFGGIYKLRLLSESLIDELQHAMDHWNEAKTCIGSVLNRQPNFPGVFEDYSYSYTKAAALLREKRAQSHDHGFTAYVSALRAGAVHSLESLLLVPNQRIQAYGKLLCDLTHATPSTHHDHMELQKVSAAVSQLLDRRTEALTNADNQAKLEFMQARFTQQLHLNRPITALFQPAKRKKITSSSNITSPTPDYLNSCGDVSVMESRQNKALVKSEPPANRRYIQEGPVQLTLLSKSLTKERYLFLLSDVLFTAKCKATATTSSNSFHLKERQRLQDVWIAPCPEDLQRELSDFDLEPHCSFLIGWPLVNYVATFKTPGEKEVWHSRIQTQIAEVSSNAHQQKVSICILNKATVGQTSYAPRKFIEVSQAHNTKDVISLALDLWKIEDELSRYCLWVTSLKEDSSSYLLLGHERPYSIKLFMNTRRLDNNNALIEDTKQQHATLPVQFTLKMVQPRTPFFAGEKQQPRGKRVRTTLGKSVSTTLVNKFFRGNRTKDSMATSDPEDLNCTASFGQPLDRVIAPDLPKWLTIALIRLYIDGPGTNGILRKSASAKFVRSLREAIDAGIEPDIAGAPALAIGALLKEFMRHIPGYILNGDLYTEWVACLDPSSNEAKTRHVRKMLERLPDANRHLLHIVLLIFAKIADNHVFNQMHSENVAICVSPSLLSPADDMQVLKNEVPPLIQFILENMDAVFEGYDVPDVIKAAEAIKLNGAESPEFSPDHLGNSAPNLRANVLSSSNDELADDEQVVLRHSGKRSLSTSTPMLFNDDFDTGSTVRSVGEPSDSGQGQSLNSMQLSDTTSTGSGFPALSQLPRGSIHIPAGPGQDARATAAAWRAAGDKDNSPAGSRLVVYRHRQAQQRALEAQQAAPSGGWVDTSPGQQQQQSSRTKLHPSASVFVDQLAQGRSPGIPHRHAADDLDSAAAAGTRNLQELYDMYSVKGKPPTCLSVSTPPGIQQSSSLPSTPRHTPGTKATLRIDPTKLAQSEKFQQSINRQWYSFDENNSAETTPVPPNPARPASAPRQSASVAPADNALFMEINKQLGRLPVLDTIRDSNAEAVTARHTSHRLQQASFDDSSSEGSSDESDDGGTNNAYIQAHEKYLHQQHTRSLGKNRGPEGSRTAEGPISATIFTRRSSVPSQPARVKTKSFELPTPRQPVFEDVKFDEESYV